MKAVIAIDGPSGSGKSSIAKALADRLGILYVDTGAMYRALAYAADTRKIPFEEGHTLQGFFGSISLSYGEGDSLVSIDGQDLTRQIREHRTSRLASDFSKLPSVREFLLGVQRGLPGNRTCVMEGRDIGTVIFPDAFCKFFVVASPETRAKRRLAQLSRQGRPKPTLEQTLKDQQQRDENDANRARAPLKQAPDAEVIDTDPYTLEDVIRLLIEKIEKRAGEVGLEL